MSAPAQWRSAGPLTDLPLNTTVGHAWDRDDGARVELVLVRREDTVYALTGRCPHRGAPFDTLGLVDPEAGELICRWHYWAFRLEDGGHTAMDSVALCRYPVEIDPEGVVRVDIAPKRGAADAC